MNNIRRKCQLQVNTAGEYNHNGSRVVFLATSDDYAWIKKHLVNKKVGRGSGGGGGRSRWSSFLTFVLIKH